MTEIKINLITAIYAKTAVGQQEVQSRSLGLAPLPRRLLILVDGKRSGQELAVFVAGHNAGELLQQLLGNGCIEALVQKIQPITSKPQATVDPIAAVILRSVDAALAKLPEASTRTAKDVEMARNVMMNTVNTIFQQNTRLTLMEAIFACKTAQDARNVYPRWAETMRSSSIGTKRLPEFHEKLFLVL